MLRYRLTRAVIKVVQVILARLVVSGSEHIPTQGPYIVTVNHMSAADTPLLLVAFPPTEWRFFAGEKWQNHWLYGPIMGWLGGVFINRGEVDRHALKEALDALDAGAVFALAPEGTRSRVGKLQEGKGGAAYLASRSDVTVLPVGIINSDVLFANIRRLRRTHIEIHIGTPYRLPDVGHRPRSADIGAYTHLIMVKIAALLPARYHGVYADSPALQVLLHGEDPWPLCQTINRQPS